MPGEDMEQIVVMEVESTGSGSSGAAAGKGSGSSGTAGGRRLTESDATAAAMDTLHQDQHSNEWPEDATLAMRHALVASLRPILAHLCADLTQYQPECLDTPPPRIGYMTADGSSLDMAIIAHNEDESELMARAPRCTWCCARTRRPPRLAHGSWPAPRPPPAHVHAHVAHPGARFRQ